MKLPNRHKLGVLTALAVLLAASTMGFLPWCAPEEEEPEPDTAPTITLTKEAGDTEIDFGGLLGLLEQLALCEPLILPNGTRVPAGGSSIPAGVHIRCRRYLETGAATAELVTSTSTPAGHYIIQYRRAGIGARAVGTLDLTITAPQNPVQACLYVYPDNEELIFYVNQNVNFYAGCSFAPEDDPIVLYKWWWDYSGSPSSPPSQETAISYTDHTYTSTGTKHTRLVVRTESGVEAEDTQDIVVQSGGLR